MSKSKVTLSAGIVTSVFVTAAAFFPTQAAAASDSDAVQQATAACRAQVKEQAKFHEMSWYARHKAVKDCVKEATAKQ
jgi:hypothetical protein